MSKLLPFWIKVIRLTIPIYIVGYLMFGVLLFTYINNTIKSDASKELYLVALDKKNSLYTFLQNAEHDVAILANSINVPIKESSFDTINNLLLAKNLQKKQLLWSCIHLQRGYSCPNQARWCKFIVHLLQTKYQK